MIRILVLLQIFILISCKNNVKSTQISSKKTDTTAEVKSELKIDSIISEVVKVDYQSITDDFKSKNQYINPFDTISVKFHFPSCKKNKDTFKCFIDNLNKVNPPFFFGPKHEPKWSVLDCINDSIFESVIKTSFNDSSYFNTEYGDRTYCYYAGYLIDKVEKYSLILMLFDYSAGYEYLLYTIDNEGKFIDKIMIGAMDSDYSETTGVLNNSKSGEIITDFFGYDSEKDELFIDKQEKKKFSIDNSGNINTSKSFIKNRLELYLPEGHYLNSSIIYNNDSIKIGEIVLGYQELDSIIQGNDFIDISKNNGKIFTKETSYWADCYECKHLLSDSVNIDSKTWYYVVDQSEYEGDGEYGIWNAFNFCHISNNRIILIAFYNKDLDNLDITFYCDIISTIKV